MHYSSPLLLSTRQVNSPAVHCPMTLPTQPLNLPSLRSLQINASKSFLTPFPTILRRDSLMGCGM